MTIPKLHLPYPATSKERFELWAEGAEMCLDQVFMSTSGIPKNPYQDRGTHLAYPIWLAALATHKAKRKERTK